MTMINPEFVRAGKPAPTHDAARPRTAVPARFGNRKAGLYRNALKRIADVVAVVAAAPVILPVIVGLACLVRLDGGPGYYSQMRVGKDGRSFRMWKLRTMVPDADARMATYLQANPAAKDEWDATQKLRNDPRITRFGRFLRRSSLDELPQLWNVLKGEMSLVGPRPMMPEQRALYPGTAYFLIRPGITGHWQTSGRNATSFASRAEYDAEYEGNLTLMTDLRILARTVRVVVKGTGC